MNSESPDPNAPNPNAPNPSVPNLDAPDLSSAGPECPALDCVFVYGTLCRDRANETWWPFPPQRVDVAFVRGHLYDLGAYPAMTSAARPASADWIQGELWTLTIEQMAATLRSLDKLEGFRGRDDDLFTRTVVDCHVGSTTADPQLAFAYHYVRSLPGASRVDPGVNGVSVWSPSL